MSDNNRGIFENLSVLLNVVTNTSVSIIEKSGNALETTAGVMNKVAQTGDNLVSVAEQKSKHYVDLEDIKNTFEFEQKKNQYREEYSLN